MLLLCQNYFGVDQTKQTPKSYSSCKLQMMSNRLIYKATLFPNRHIFQPIHPHFWTDSTVVDAVAHSISMIQVKDSSGTPFNQSEN